MKIVVIGLGKVGRSLSKNLCDDGHDVTVIDNQPQLVYDAVNTMDVQGICGNGASYDIQSEAKVEEADLLIAATDSDEINILSCFLAKKFGAKLLQRIVIAHSKSTTSTSEISSNTIIFENSVLPVRPLMIIFSMKVSLKARPLSKNTFKNIILTISDLSYLAAYLIR